MFADPREIIGTWSTSLHPSGLDAFNDPTSGFAELSFNTDNTFSEVFQLGSNDGANIGRYNFDGNTIQFIVDDFTPKVPGAPIPIAYHANTLAPIDFSPDGLQMAFLGEIWDYRGVSEASTAGAQPAPQSLSALGFIANPSEGAAHIMPPSAHILG